MSKLCQTKIRSLTAKYSAGHVVDWHSHDWHQLLYATTGVIHLKTRCSRWVIPCRRAVWIPSGFLHEVAMSGALMMRTIYFHPSMNIRLADECLAMNVTNLMHELIIHTCEMGIIKSDSADQRCLIDFLVCQTKKMQLEPLMLPMPVQPRALRAARSMLENPSQDLAFVVKEASSSLRTLQRVFAAETGLTLGRWQTQARLLSALPKLEEGRQVTEVSMDVGFESLSAFISAFRKFFGVTPGKYFRKARNT